MKDNLFLLWEKMRAYSRKDDNTQYLLCRITEITYILIFFFKFLLMKYHA